jgi:amidophosphoribosyltransferase
MAKMGDFIAFQAAISLIGKRNMEDMLDGVYHKCKEQLNLPKEQMVNYVKEVYAPFTEEEISDEIAVLLKHKDVKADVKIIYQSIEGLHQACPDHKGDWYFSGNYPTPGGVKVVNKAFINYMEGVNERAY